MRFVVCWRESCVHSDRADGGPRRASGYTPASLENIYLQQVVTLSAQFVAE